MVILGITSSLIAPDMFSMVKRSQAKTELAKIKAIADLSIERSFFSASKFKITFKGNTILFSQVKDSKMLDDKILKTIESEFFTFEDRYIVINKGRWQGSHLVKVIKSPDNKLKELILFTASQMTKAMPNENEATEEQLYEVGNNQVNFSKTVNNDVEGGNE